MPLKLCAEGKMVTACLIGEIDHHGAGKLREEIDTMLERNHPDTLILDFREVTFMDSSGIGLIMGRYRALGMGQKCIMAVNAGSHIDKLLHLSGVHRYMEIQRAEEEGEDYGFFQHIDTAGRTCPVFVWNAGYGRWPGESIRRKTGTDS